MSPRRRDRLLHRLAPKAQRLAERVGPAARLGRIDVVLLRAWARNVGAVASELGQAEARAFTELVCATADTAPDVARLVAFTLPDHLARVPAEQRARYCKLLGAVQQDRPSALPLVIRTLPELLERMGDEALSLYLARGLEMHQASSQKAESFLRMDSREGQAEAVRLQKGLQLGEVQRTLMLYARAHCGEDVQVRVGAEGAFTDGRHLYLPAVVDQFGDERDFLVYRVLTARNAGYLEFGSMDLDLAALSGEWPLRQPGEVELERFFRGFENGAIARDLFQIYETTRVEARVRAEYPGVARDMDALADAWRPERPESAGLAPAEQAIEWLASSALGQTPPEVSEDRVSDAAAQALAALDQVRSGAATVQDTARAVQAAYPAVYGLMRQVDEDQLERLDGRDDGGAGDGPSPQGGSQGGEGADGVDHPFHGPEPDELEYRPMAGDRLGSDLRTDEMSHQDRDLEARAQSLLEAMRASDDAATLADARKEARKDGSSYEEMAAFLDRVGGPAGPLAEHHEGGPAAEGELAPMGPDGNPLDPDVERSVRRFLYPEWDAGIEDHKPRWVCVTEYKLQPGSSRFVDDVRREYGPQIAKVRRAFEALRPDGMQRLRGLPDGDEIDIDRAIQARIERRAGGSPSDRIYMQHHREQRDVAVAFLLDMSSSTNEVVGVDAKRVIDVEKEALVMISEAVDAIGDRLGIYGFSGYGRDQVAFYVAKDFDDPWDDRVRERIGRISWKMENRDGAAIRHLTQKLAKQPARIKLMMLLSDGKPLDCGCDHYADRYAQEDTRMALREARRAGIHPFCITIDPHGPKYLRRMYGEVGYTVIDRADSLPERLPMIYRRLTR